MIKVRLFKIKGLQKQYNYPLGGIKKEISAFFLKDNTFVKKDLHVQLSTDNVG